MGARRFAGSLLLAIALGVAGARSPAHAGDAPDSGLEVDPSEAADAAAEDAEAADTEDESGDEDDLAAVEEEQLEEPGRRDPFEGFNRDVFSFNRRVDRGVFDPITRGYQVAVPALGRRAFYNVFQNLDSPMILANHMAQLRVVAAATTTTRFVINTSLGVAGLWDPAADIFEVQRLEGDFGQTLAEYGMPSGPYLMLPVFGPSTARDVFGDVVDILADPVSYLIGPIRWWTIVLGGGEGLTTREAHFDELKELEAGSVDFYSALRSAYLQSRDAMVREARAELARMAASPKKSD
jgi:phospholipid-binding lipoprotein MlaA